MKKILSLIFLTTLFVACSDDSDENKTISKTVIIGEWYYTTPNDSNVIEFTQQACIEYRYYPQAKDPLIWDNGDYRLTKSEILFSDGDGLNWKYYYQIKDDSLFLRFNHSEAIKKYVRAN